MMRLAACEPELPPLEMISGIEEASVKPTRYRPRNRPDLPLVIPANEPLDLIFANSFTPQF